MSLKFYWNTPFAPGTEIEPVDTFVGDGVTSTFQLTAKTATELHSTIQVGSQQKAQLTGGFTKNTSNNTFTLNAAPSNGTQIVAPGIGQLVASAYDQNTVPGVTNPRVIEVPFWLADIDSIHLVRYEAVSGQNGLLLAIENLISSLPGALVSWCEIASADGNGAATVYQTAVGFTSPPLVTYMNLVGTASAGASSVTVDTVTGLVAGDYFIINIGNPTAEIRRIKSIDVGLNKLVLESPLDFTHTAGELLFQNGRQYYLRVTVPENFSSGEPVNLYNLCLSRLVFRRSRI